MWVRGLKQSHFALITQFAESHPMWVRGLKHVAFWTGADRPKSHPMWVRGLKQVRMVVSYLNKVAPYVGAWIETINYGTKNFKTTSHPMWVRGLKLNKMGLEVPCGSRTLCGCVD